MTGLDNVPEHFKEEGPLGLPVLGKKIRCFCEGVGSYEHLVNGPKETQQPVIVLRGICLQAFMLSDEMSAHIADNQKHQ